MGNVDMQNKNFECYEWKNPENGQQGSFLTIETWGTPLESVNYSDYYLSGRSLQIDGVGMQNKCSVGYEWNDCVSHILSLPKISMFEMM